GELRSNKGLNLPGIELGIPAFTDHDYECMKHALESGVDAVSQSFVNNAGDLLRLKKTALELGYRPFVIAKIERSVAVENLDEILQASDGIMIARGDLGVEIPIEKIAIIQKQIIQKANLLGKPVITATQMLGSMVSNSRPTRAEVSDVSNAIYDGTDCVMLSEESAMGKYPVESALMLAKIAVSVEDAKTEGIYRRRQDFYRKDNTHITDTISYNVYQSVSHLNASAVFVQTQTGYVARMISRFKLSVWVMSVTSDIHVFRSLQFSYGLMPILSESDHKNWNTFIQKVLKVCKQASGIIILVEAPSKDKLNDTHRMSIIHLPN
ncbi:MAG TPA: pyruvate kinase, partial [Candidatus Cloacimonadota bacterium]|nr:pyruvate kinase [Candidatus Cloacimonadota bacterium]